MGTLHAHMTICAHDYPLPNPNVNSNPSPDPDPDPSPAGLAAEGIQRRDRLMEGGSYDHTWV